MLLKPNKNLCFCQASLCHPTYVFYDLGSLFGIILEPKAGQLSPKRSLGAARLEGQKCHVGDVRRMSDICPTYVPRMSPAYV